MSAEYYVNFNEHAYPVREPDPNDSYDNGDYGLDVSINSVHKNKITGWNVRLFSKYDQSIPYDDISVGDTAYVIVARYNTGDTFGTSATWCIPAICATYEAAEQALKRLEDSSEQIYRPWSGYFESLDSLTIEEFIVR